MPYCTSCGAQMAGDAGFCSACGRPSGEVPFEAITQGRKDVASSSGLADNLAGMLAYITIIPPILFLLAESYRRRRFVRFHALQCLYFALACMAASFVLRIVAFFPVARWMALALWPLLGIAELMLWVICVFRAYQGQMFKLPVIGNIAEQQASTAPDITRNRAKAA